MTLSGAPCNARPLGFGAAPSMASVPLLGPVNLGRMGGLSTTNQLTNNVSV